MSNRLCLLSAWAARGLFAIIIAISVAGTARAEPARIALLIGNKGYAPQIGRLTNPHNDVDVMARSLRQIGFKVHDVMRDAGQAAIQRALNAYVREVREAGPGAIAFFYYSGHGASDGSVNYVIPVDATSADTTELWDQSIRLTDIIARLKSESGDATHFVVFDACRNTLKLTAKSTKAIVQAKGFVPVRQESGMLISYATAEGDLASDVGEGAGPYAQALAEEIVKPGVEAVSVFRNVQIRVKQALAQNPWLSFPALPPVYLAGKISDQPKADETQRLKIEAVYRCEELAAPFGYSGRSSGVRSKAIETDTAIEACEAAFRYAPESPSVMYLLGRVLSQSGNWNYANRLFEKAVALNSFAAMNSLGYAYESGEARSIDLAKARALYEKSANGGFALGMNNLAYMYDRGVGVAQDLAVARGLYEKAAAAGEPLAMVNLGRLHDRGAGVTQDSVKARALYETAAALGEPLAMNNLGWLYDRGAGVPQDFAAARNWYEKAAALGEPLAMTNIGRLYERGVGLPQDSAQARQWYEQAAALGEPFSMNNLGHLFERGAGVPQDFAAARAWYEKAAAKHNALAMTNLGFLHERGLGAPQDFSQARVWYEKAAAVGEPSAMNNLGWLYDRGSGVPQDFAVARAWYEKAAAKDNALAMNNLGWMYDRGAGIQSDFLKAREWYEKAAARQNVKAMHNLARLYAEGLGVPKDLVKAREWRDKAKAAEATK
ncbi:MAG: caspase family protein [Hyphomicrobiaceae bacterium]|nr:caspase family protein [Hyphomicrobiaceae bacterium]